MLTDGNGPETFDDENGGPGNTFSRETKDRDTGSGRRVTIEDRYWQPQMVGCSPEI